MEKNILKTVCDTIYRRFPEIAGSQPKIQTRPGDQYLLIFHGVSQTSNGHALPRTVRVVTTSDGKITKVTTSH
jgi:hypothetical protein